MEEDLSKLKAGDPHYKAYVGPPLKFDLLGALQFNLLTSAGLRDHHTIVDIGCGSLRAGKMLIPYLKAGHYYGLEPEKWLVEEGIQNELGEAILSVKKPHFAYRGDYRLSSFQTQFDFLIAQSIFSHSPMQQVSDCLQEACKTMHGKSLFLATFINGKEDYRGNAWRYPGCVEYRHRTILQMAKEAGLEGFRTSWPHPNGQRWYVFYKPGNEEAERHLLHHNLDVFRPAKPQGILSKIRKKFG